MTSALDKAIVAYRENPTAANRKRLLALQRAHNDRFAQDRAEEYVRRAKDRK